MNIEAHEPGMVPFEWNDVKFEIKALSNGEIIEHLGTSFPDLVVLYLKNIKNLKINGRPIKEGKDLLDPSTPASKELMEFYFFVLEKFREINYVGEEEEKNSDAPPVE